MGREVLAEFPRTPTQLAFAGSPARLPLMCSGMGAGKSDTLRKKFLRRVSENWRLMGRKTPAFYLAPTYDMVHNLIVPGLADDLLALGIPHRFSDSNHLLELVWRGRKTFTRLLSAENYERYMGPEVPFMMGDELELCFRANQTKIELMWRKLLSRLRVKGSTASFDVASTPEGFGFLWEWWDQRPRRDPRVAADYAIFRCPTRENAANLPADYIENLERDFDPQRLKAYLEGDFVNLTAGAVYHAFDRKRHVTSGLKLVPGVPIEFHWDFNVDPMAVSVAQYVEPDLRTVAEVTDRSGKGTEEACRILIDRFGDHPGPAIMYGDASSKARRSSSGGRSDRDIIDLMIGEHWSARGYEVRWEESNPWPPDRYAAVNAFLAAGRWVIDESCPGLIGDLSSQPYKRGSKQADDQGGKLGHWVDGPGYRIVRDFPAGRSLEERIRGKTA